MNREPLTLNREIMHGCDPSNLSSNMMGPIDSIRFLLLVLFGVIWCRLVLFGPKIYFRDFVYPGWFFRVAWMKDGIRVERHKLADLN